jgi:hypothetical protein
MATRKVRQQIFFFPLFFCCYCIRDPRYGICDGKKSGPETRSGSVTLRFTIPCIIGLLHVSSVVSLMLEGLFIPGTV